MPVIVVITAMVVVVVVVARIVSSQDHRDVVRYLHQSVSKNTIVEKTIWCRPQNNDYNNRREGVRCAGREADMKSYCVTRTV